VNTFPALIADRDKFTKLLKRLWLKLAHCLTNFLITYTITQANVHKHSRSISAQSVNENSYDYNSTRLYLLLTAGSKKSQKKRAPKRSFSYKGISD